MKNALRDLGGLAGAEAHCRDRILGQKSSKWQDRRIISVNIFARYPNPA